MADLLPHVSPNHFVIIGNPGNQRIQFFQKALQDFGQSQADIVSYTQLIQDPHRRIVS
ncbi:hypothetical protein V144x_51960 [Gimesia aquarii]|uniref:Uncharacterized protein n=1 Tax=Gimesia aquarii TaxID=2527964 RepID=A0A517W353_9PLAN|nr:hypothetical protein V144x_51960 [Gimesia aquarii]